MKKLISLLCATLLFVGCQNDLVNPTKVQKPNEDKGPIMLRRPELHNGISIDSDLDRDYLYSASEAQALLKEFVEDYHFDDVDVTHATMYSVYTESYIFDLATLMDHTNWTGNPLANVYEQLYEQTFLLPSIYYYVFNFPNGGYAIVHADKRILSPIATLTNSGPQLYDFQFDLSDIADYAISHEEYWEIFERKMDSLMRLVRLEPFVTLPLHTQYMEFCKGLEHIFTNTADPNSYENVGDTLSFPRILWSVPQNNNAIPSEADYLTTNIPTALVKMLTLENYNGFYLSNSFYGNNYSNPDSLSALSFHVDKTYIHLPTHHNLLYNCALDTLVNNILIHTADTVLNPLHVFSQTVNKHPTVIVKSDTEWQLIYGLMIETTGIGTYSYYFVDKNDSVPSKRYYGHLNEHGMFVYILNY